MIERNFDIPFIADLALREKQIQQNYRPIIAVHKWFARRPGTLFRGLLLSEFLEKPLHESFYQANSLKGIKVADPFMGGGTPLIEANRLGCEIAGLDINPMTYWIVKQEIEHLDLDAYLRAANSLREQLEKETGSIAGDTGTTGKCSMPGNFSAWSYPHSGSASASAAGRTLSRSSERQKRIVTVRSKSDTRGEKRNRADKRGMDR